MTRRSSIAPRSVPRAFLALALLLPVAVSDSVAAEIQGIRHSSVNNRTRVVLDLDRAAAYQHSILGNPPRVLITLNGFGFAPGVQERAVGDGYVRRIRIIPERRDRAQVVLDLERALEYKTFPLDNPPRIVVDVQHSGAPAPPERTPEPEPEPEPTPPATRDEAPADEADAPAPRETPAERDAAVEEPVVAPEATAPRTVIPARPPEEGPWIVAIDAGHGGTDPGSTHFGTQEKDITLALAIAVQKELDGRDDIRAFLVRKGDYFIPLRQRWLLAEKEGADLFVSIHCDGAEGRDAKGTTVFRLSEKGASDEFSRQLALSENRADERAGVVPQSSGDDKKLDEILLDMSQNHAFNASEVLAEMVLEKLMQLGTVYNRGVRQAGFAVLKSPHMPSILVEAAFISNPRENKMLRDERWQRQFAIRLVDGIEAYCRSLEPAE